MDVQKFREYVERNRDNLVVGAVIIALLIGGGVYYLNQNRSKQWEPEMLYIRAMIGDPRARDLFRTLVTGSSNTFWGKMAALDLTLADLLQGKESSAADYVRFLKKSKNPLLKSSYYSHAASFNLKEGKENEGIKLLEEGERAAIYRTFKDYFKLRRAKILYEEGKYEEAKRLLQEIAEDYDSPYRDDARLTLRKVKLLSEVK